MTALRTNFEVFAERNIRQQKIDLYLTMQNDLGDQAVAQPIVMQTLPSDDLGARMVPFMQLTPHAAQQLMDELWRCKVRPTDMAGSATETEAVKAHLSDMREIAYFKLGITK